ncbi:hypothetical protein B484DRAFT_456949 [Ochromonadaceae sp. CCMP2298]|nr:hypothetical protein B484DRAFT_456949 [Ochromonadaceae sp. CCMP2298]
MVSPSSDFLMSLSTIMVEQHLQQTDIRRRTDSRGEGGEGGRLWSADSLQRAFRVALAKSQEMRSVHEYAARYASFRIATTTGAAETDPGGSVARWSHGLFSAAGLEDLQVTYEAAWPVPAVISQEVLSRFTCVTRRFLELSQLVALFRTVWGEQRLRRVQQQRAPGAPGRYTRSAEERQLWEGMRLVQQTVQAVFDYLSERVHVHQIRFKRSMRGTSESGLNGVVHALDTYASDIAGAALQMDSREQQCARQATAQGDPPMGMSPLLELKWALNAMLQFCRESLHKINAVNEGSKQGREEPVQPLLDALKRCNDGIKRCRQSAVQAAIRAAALNDYDANISSLIQRLA